MVGAELRRFVGGPFPNLIPATVVGRPSDGIVGGPYANLAPVGSSRSRVTQMLPRGATHSTGWPVTAAMRSKSAS
jgi:hypothetical protein